MRIHVLSENTTCRADLEAEHGLSLLIESGGRGILLDTGASAAFARNAERMGLSLSAVDVAVLSHGHYDHGGGIERFFQLNKRAALWVSPHAFDPHFNAAGKDIGLSPALAGHARLRRPAQDVTNLAPGVQLHRAAAMPAPYPAEGAGMTAVVDGERVADDFRHEQYLLLQEGGLRVLISGCSHRGVLNIATHFRPDVLVGGFHFMKVDPEMESDRLRAAANTLLELPTRYYTGHCTGAGACSVLKPLLGERLSTFATGHIIELTSNA